MAERNQTVKGKDSLRKVKDCEETWTKLHQNYFYRLNLNFCAHGQDRIQEAVRICPQKNNMYV